MDMSQPVDKAYLTDATNAQEVYGKLSFISTHRHQMNAYGQGCV